MTVSTLPLTIFGREFNVYSGSCCSATSPKRTLYVELTDICNARCPFCSATRGTAVLSPEILEDTLRELVTAGAVDRVSVTGGEPLTVGQSTLSRLLDVLDASGIDYYAITTNGRFLENNLQLLDSREKLRYLNVSRHRYDDEENRKVFGDRGIPALDDVVGMFGMLENGRRKFRLNCTLGPDTGSADVLRYIKSAGDRGIRNILFRADYFGSSDPEMRKLFGENLPGIKESTKCRCMYGEISGVSVEYREVDATHEQELERAGEYIRNFVLHADGRLTGGWSKESILINGGTDGK